MPTRRIEEDIRIERKDCEHPEHNPPSNVVFQPGLYEHTCPGCGSKQIFRVNEQPHLAPGECAECGGIAAHIGACSRLQ